METALVHGHLLWMYGGRQSTMVREIALWSVYQTWNIHPCDAGSILQCRRLNPGRLDMLVEVNGPVLLGLDP